MNDIKLFVIPGEPTGKGRPRFNRYTARAYTPQKTASYEAKVALAYREKFTDADFFPAGIPVSVDITVRHKIPASASKKKAAEMACGILKPTKKPDCDNILKVVCDALNGVAWYDDAQVIRATIRKEFANVPCVVVRINKA